MNKETNLELIKIDIMLHEKHLYILKYLFGLINIEMTFNKKNYDHRLIVYYHGNLMVAFEAEIRKIGLLILLKLNNFL